MAAIGTIRKYSGIAVGFIGISILAFVISDAFKSNSRLFNKNKLTLGTIAGQEISYQDFQRRFDQEIETYKQRNQVDNVTEDIRTQMRDELWQKISDEIIYSKEYDATGVVISPEELAYTVSGPNPHQAVQQFFVDPETKQFDRNRLIGFLKNMDQYPDLKAIWLDFEQELIKEKLRQKYFSIIKQSLFVTNLEAKDDYYAKNKFANFDYVSLRLNSIPDSTIQVTEKEVENKYQEVKSTHEVEASRSFDFVIFDVIPTAEDTAFLYQQLEKFKVEYAKTKNDSLFVEVNSDQHFDTVYRQRGYFNEIIDEAYFDGDNQDSIIGPFEEDGYIKIAKLADKKVDTVMYYRASHILIRPAGSTDQDTADAMAKAREYMQQVNNGDDFAMMAMRHSDDKGSGVKGGDLGWFRDGAMVKPFMDAVKRTKPGQMTVVKSQFGAHLIKITEAPSKTLIKVGIIAKTIEPSSQTYKDAYSKATTFAGSVSTFEEFEQTVMEEGLDKRIVTDISQNEREVAGFPNSRKLISWAFGAELHDISDIIEFEDKFVVAVLTEVVEAGFAPLEKIRIEIENQVRTDKKKEQLEKRLAETKTGKNNLQEIATSVESTVENVTNTSFSVPMLAGIGEEKTLIGSIFGMQPDHISDPIVGNNAVFLVKVNNFSQVEEPENLDESKKALLDNLQGMSQYETMESLKDLAKIKDERYKFF